MTQPKPTGLPRERFPHPPSAGTERDRKVLQVVSAGTAGQAVADDGLFSELSRELRATYGFSIRPHHFAVLGKCRHCAAP